ncbi:glycosyltransferase [Microbacterium sp. zg.B48]|uniref:glycosyltransferase n=1 Tax=unclassified Microbacterium TaxID=2609290 RepID=UPI00214AC100|nr:MULTISPECIES: glycosyltransferase [unclassified Microbacterium]MCR2763298.1 glycosyltransferase [Microbacterium sp. zg.B48]MCR2808887.1 glycosyltransferase [Microbacterium sp. zg.B185]WIM18694.1 glycosyltransferase [Microbacterium sp. zg-B185]
MTATAPSPVSSPGSTPPGQDFVFTFSYESYADARKRGMMRPPDRLVSTLIDSPEVRRLLIADPYRSWLTNWGRSVIDFRHRARETEKVRHVSPLRTARADPTQIDEIADVYLGYERAVLRAAAAAALVEPSFVTANPLVAGFSRLEWTGGALYYARDDWLSSPGRRRYWPAYQEAYRRIAESGRAVAAVSQEIIDRIGPRGPHAVVPNGIEPREWSGPVPSAPAWFARIPGPRAVYVGTLDSRLDIAGLTLLARARPDLHIVLIGPAPSPSYIASLKGLPNVHIRGEVGRREVIGVLRNSELTLLAHRRTPLTEAMSPLKVYEYLAAGKPVLATDLRPVRGFGERVHLTDTVSDFIDVIDSALAQGTLAETERRAFVTENAWSSRHKEILTLLTGG